MLTLIIGKPLDWDPPADLADDLLRDVLNDRRLATCL